MRVLVLLAVFAGGLFAPASVFAHVEGHGRSSGLLREWQNPWTGERVGASMLLVRDGNVHLELADGTTVQWPVKHLTAADRDAAHMRKHADGHLVRVAGRSEVYYLHQGRILQVRRPDLITNRVYGAGWEDILYISAEELNSYAIGGDLYVGPRLLKTSSSSRIWYIFNDRYKREVASPQVLNGLGLAASVETVGQFELDRYQTDTVAPTLFAPAPDGTLVKSPDSPAIYVISNGTKRRIATERVLRDSGYTFQRVRLMTPTTIASIPDGPVIDASSLTQ